MPFVSCCSKAYILSVTMNTPTHSSFILKGTTCRIPNDSASFNPCLLLKWLIKKKKLSNNPEHRDQVALSSKVTTSDRNTYDPGDSQCSRDLRSHKIGKLPPLKNPSTCRKY